MKKYLWLLLIPAVAVASSIKTWSSAETIRASDLNSNFSHLHSNLGHGHGTIITNADVSATAAIAHTKMATPALLPKAWGRVVSCDQSAASGTTCGTMYDNGVAFVSSSASIYFNVFLDALPSTANFGVIVSTGDPQIVCAASTYAVGTLYPTVTTPQFRVYCEDASAGTASTTVTNMQFIVVGL